MILLHRLKHPGLACSLLRALLIEDNTFVASYIDVSVKSSYFIPRFGNFRRKLINMLVNLDFIGGYVASMKFFFLNSLPRKDQMRH